MGKSTLLIWVFLASFVSIPFSEGPAALLVASGAILLLVIASLRILSRAALALVAFSCAATLAGFYSGRLDWAQLGVAAERGTVLCAFIFSLGMLVFAASRSSLVSDVGTSLTKLRPGKRYWALCLSSALLGPMLSISVVSLLNAVVQSDLRSSEYQFSDRAHEIITRRTATAIMRGMSIVPLWSPVSVTIILVGTRIPDLRWIDYLPLGLLMAFVMIVIGWALDRLTFAGIKGNFAYQDRIDWRPLFCLFVILMSIPLCSVALEYSLGISFTLALIFAFSVVGIFWIGHQELSARDGSSIQVRFGTAIAGLNARLVNSANEAVVLFVAGALSGILFPLINIGAISNAAAGSGVSNELLLVCALVVTVLLSLIGINSVVSSAVILDVFLTAPGLLVSQSLLVLSVTLAFGISTVISPIGVGVLLTSRETQVPAEKVAYSWNTAYAALGLVAFALITFFFQ